MTRVDGRRGPKGNAAATRRRRRSTVTAGQRWPFARPAATVGLALGVALASTLAPAGPAAAAAVEREGMRYDDSLRVGNERLVLNGVGVRGGNLFQGYVAGLYLPKRLGDADEIYAARGAKRIAVRLLVGVNAGLLSRTFADGIRKNYKDDALDALRDRMGTFDAQIHAAGDLRKGDSVDLDWQPAVGTRLVVNGKSHGEPIPGDDFYVALLKMFIGERAVDKGLRSALLGQPAP